MQSNYLGISNEKVLLTDVRNYVNPILSLCLFRDFMMHSVFFLLNGKVMETSHERDYKVNCFSSFAFYMDFSFV